ncbi:MAG: hypothetical protein M1376_20740 [Planctomycetes bacterium]|nr:hypothetical protein [Planctomycetota bacterium]
MESGNHLGIYWSKNKATVVCLAPPGRERKVLDCFAVSVDGEEQGQQALADRVVQMCRQRKVKFTDVGVALDCASFMQHVVHSEFSDPKRIAATVRFDTEEALATDISEMAVSFRIASPGEEGANLDVFTAPRAILSDILLSLQSHRIDPVAVDPDVCCLARYLVEYAEIPEPSDQSTLYALLSDGRGYLVVMSGLRQASVLRTFLLGSAQERTTVLARETLVTTALADTAHPVGRLCVFDAQGGLRTESLHEGTGLAVSVCEPAALARVKSNEIREGVNAVDFALACGAALSPAEKVDSVNLRNDHMPYLGRKRKLQNRVRLLSISVTILLLTVGVFFHSQLIRVNKQRESLRDKLELDYLAVMPGETKLPVTMKQGVDKLGSTLRRLQNDKTGVMEQGSIAAKLTLVLQGINGCARQTDLNIRSIAITGTSIVVNGDTSSRENTVNVMGAAMEKVGLKIDRRSVNTEGGRDTFSITLVPLNKGKGA